MTTQTPTRNETALDLAIGRCLGVSPTGRDVALPGITVLHFQDGRCVERWSCADMLGVLVQIGAVPPPA